jgi:hypothetical protein
VISRPSGKNELPNPQKGLTKLTKGVVRGYFCQFCQWFSASTDLKNGRAAAESSRRTLIHACIFHHRRSSPRWAPQISEGSHDYRAGHPLHSPTRFVHGIDAGDNSVLSPWWTTIFTSAVDGFLKLAEPYRNKDPQVHRASFIPGGRTIRSRPMANQVGFRRNADWITFRAK